MSLLNHGLEPTISHGVLFSKRQRGAIGEFRYSLIFFMGCFEWTRVALLHIRLCTWSPIERVVVEQETANVYSTVLYAAFMARLTNTPREVKHR